MKNFIPDFDHTLYRFNKFFFEIELSKLSSLRAKDVTEADFPGFTIEFYKSVAGVFTLMESPTQSELDLSCVRTRIKYERPEDILIMGGGFAQKSSPLCDIHGYQEVGPDAYNLTSIDGINLDFIAPFEFFSVESERARELRFNDQYDLNLLTYDFQYRGLAGKRHRLMLFLDLFIKLPGV